MIDDDKLIEIPVDEIALEIEADGTPKTVPGSKAATGAPIESEGEPEPRKPRKIADKAALTEADVDAARRQTAQAAQAEIDRLARLAASERQRADKSTTQAFNAHLARTVADYHKTAADYQSIAGAITSTQALLDASKRELKTAYEASDFDKVADLQAHIGTAAAHLTALEQGKSGAESEVRRAEAEWKKANDYAESVRNAPREEPKPERPSDATQLTPEQWIAQWPRKTTGTWLNGHKEYVTDPGKHRQLLEFAAEYAADYGTQMMHTPGFVEALNEKFDPHSQEEEPAVAEPEDTIAAEKPTPRKSAPPAAPVSRSGQPGRPSGSTTIKLTQQEYAAAPTIYETYDDLDADTRRKFPAWSETAARYQYDRDKKRAEADGKYLKLRR